MLWLMSFFYYFCAMQKLSSSPNYKQELRKKILTTAMRDFRRQGIKAVKMDDIAKSLSISKRTLYELYCNKEELLNECVSFHDAEMEKKFRSRIKKDSNVMDILITFISIHVENSSKINPVFFTELHKYPKVRRSIQKRGEERKKLSIGFLYRGVEEGYFRSDINYEIADLMVEVFMNHVMENEVYRQYPLRELFRNVIMLMLRGFCTPKGQVLIDEFTF